MRCPFCGNNQDKVIDSRSSKDEMAVRRRRKCLDCGERFTTYEYIEDFPLVVVKRDNRREPYERKKLLNGIITACKKRPISIKKIEDIVDNIESEIKNLSNTEVDSMEIGKRIMDALLEIDDVAYMRFASVYRNFRDKTEFIKEVKGIDIRD